MVQYMLTFLKDNLNRPRYHDRYFMVNWMIEALFKFNLNIHYLSFLNS